MASDSFGDPSLSQPQQEDLWQRALDTLDESLKAKLNYKPANKANIVSTALFVAQEKKQRCIQKRWKLVKSNGDIVVLRDVMEKIIAWLERFKAVGDVLMQYNVAHAALPWAAVRFVLQVAVSDTHAFGTTLLGLESISRLINRYAVFEEVYARQHSAFSSEFEATLVQLYAEVLKYLATTRQYFETSTARRIVKSAILPDEDARMQTISSTEKELSRLAKLVDAKRQHNFSQDLSTALAALSRFEAPINRLNDQADIASREMREEKYLHILRWTSSIPFSRHHARIAGSRIPNTGDWLLTHPSYVHWQSCSSSSVLVLQGTIGSGKTCLTSMIIDSFLEEKRQIATPVPFAYFYCARNVFETERSDSEEIMRSLVRQMTVAGNDQRTVLEVLVNEFNRREAQANMDGFDIPRLSSNECVKLILEITNSNSAVIVVDAIDELEESMQYELVRNLIEIVKAAASVVKIFVTARDSVEAVKLFPYAKTVRVDGQNVRRDLELFVQWQIDKAISDGRLLGGKVSEELREDLIVKLCDGAVDMFLWVVLQVESLCQMHLEMDIRTAAQQLSRSTIESLYANLFNASLQNGTTAGKVAVRAFSWLLCSQEALKPTAFLTALAWEDQTGSAILTLSDLLAICHGLIIEDSTMNILRFAHTSVQEFFEAKPMFSTGNNHQLAAITSLNMCISGPPSSIQHGLDLSQDFYQYSTLYWPKHCRLALCETKGDALIQKLEDFIFDDNEPSLTFIAWMADVTQASLHLDYDHFLKKAINAIINASHSPLFVACIFGLNCVINTLTKLRIFDWDQKNDSGHTGLYLASANGFDTIVSLLLQQGACVSPSGGKYGSPIHAAAYAGHISTVQLLLKHGASANERSFFKTPFHACCFGGHEEVALMIIDYGLDVSNPDKCEEFLQEAAQAGFLKIIGRLQEQYAPSSEISERTHKDAVQLAILKGRAAVLERLVRNSTPLKEDIPSNALSLAAIGGCNNIIKLLLSEGFDVEQQGPFGTPLRAASLMGHQSSVRLLLEGGAKVNAYDRHGDSLQASAMQGHFSIVRLLIDSGADVTLTGGTYGTALQAAAYRGHRDVVECLLDAGALVAQGGISKDAFHAASEGGHEDIISLFLERGFEIDKTPCHSLSPRYARGPANLFREASPSRGNSPWHHRTASRRPPNRIEENMEYNASNALTAAFEIARKYETPEVETYRRQWTTAQNFKRDENYALEAAASKGHASVVKLILERSLSMPQYISSKEVGAALVAAATNGYPTIVKHLLASEFDLLQQVRSALSGLTSSWSREMVETFLFYIQTRRESTNIDLNQNPLDISSVKHKESQQGPLDEYELSLQDVFKAGCKSGCSMIITVALDSVRRQSSIEKDAILTGDILSHGFRLACANGHLKVLSSIITLAENNSGELRDYPKSIKESACNIVNSRVGKDETYQVQGMCIDGLLAASSEGHISIVQFLVTKLQDHGLTRGLIDRALRSAANKGHADVVSFLRLARAETADLADVVEETNDVSIAGIPVASIISSMFEGFQRKRSHSKAVSEVVQSLQSHSAFCYDNTVPNPDCGDSLQANDESRFGPLDREGRAICPWSQEEAKRILAEALHDLSPFEGDQFAMFQGSIHEVLSRGPGATIKQLLPLLRGESLKDEKYGLLLQMAAVGNDHECVDLLLHRGLDVNIKGWDYGSGLQAAARYGNTYIARRLIEFGADVNASGGKYGTAMLAAVKGGHFEVVEVLLETCADVNLEVRQESGYPRRLHPHPLLLAIQTGRHDLAKVLLNAGANVNVNFGDRLPNLIEACWKGDLAMAQLLLANGADVGISGRTGEMKGGGEYYGIHGERASALHMSCKEGHREIVAELLARKADLDETDEDSHTALHLAASEGHLSIVQLLLEAGADVNVDTTRTILHLAAREGHSAIVRILLEAGAKVNVNCIGGTALHYATRRGHLAVVQLLLDAGADVNIDYKGTALADASEKGHINIARALISRGAAIIGDPRPIADPHAHTVNPLRRACIAGHEGLIRILLEQLFGMVHEESICADAMHAVRATHEDKILELMLSYGAPPYPTLLGQACAAGMIKSVRLLLAQGAPVNGAKYGETPLLHIAAFHQQLEAVQVLLEPGAFVDTKDSALGSSLIATLEGYLVSFLKGADRSKPCRKWQKPDVVKSLELDESYSSLVAALPAQKDFLNWSRGGDRVVPQSQILPEVCRQIVQALLEHGANANTELRGFGGALHLASMTGNEGVVQLLLDHGADINLEGGYFGTPLEAADAFHHEPVIELLLLHGAWSRNLDKCTNLQICGQAQRGDGSELMKD